MNYADPEIGWTRITEHKYFAPWENHAETICFKEFSRSCAPDDVPYYPVRLVEDKNLLSVYLEKARAEKGASFLGRLGTYRYLDMDASIREAMDAAARICALFDADEPLPSFFCDFNPKGAA